MTAPAIAAQRFLWACLIGAGLGAVYDFLRPLRPRWTALSDLLFLAASGWGWVYLNFGICGADLRPAWAVGLGAGGFFWELTLGRLLRPVFSGFWMLGRRFFSFLTLPAKKILKKTKILFASAEKWVTIKWSNRRHR